MKCSWIKLKVSKCKSFSLLYFPGINEFSIVFWHLSESNEGKNKIFALLFSSFSDIKELTQNLNPYKRTSKTLLSITFFLSVNKGFIIFYN